MTVNKRWAAAAMIVFAATVLQLVVATLFAASLPQFQGKGFAGRLVAYPVLMLAVPAAWALLRRRRTRRVGRATGGTGGTGGTGAGGPLPWDGFALIMVPFLIDVTGNSLDLYDSVVWWDDANHFVNWLLLCAGVGLLLRRSRIAPPWALGLAVTGIGALLAIAWELAEWLTFIRFGTELDTAYRDTLGDLLLGSLGGSLAGLLVARAATHADSP